MQTPARLPRRSAVRVPALAALLATLILATIAPVTASAANFPAKDSRYHNYAEMLANIMQVETARPEIVDVFTMGTSYQGREIWAAKVSDNVGVDESEHEVLFDAVHHAREHFTLEQAIYLLRMLVDGYVQNDPAIKPLVQTREIWIIFMVNPDGAEYDLTGNPDAPYRAWRKNRQPIPSSSSIGIDLNRNYGYKWGCCGGSSTNPASITYRGPSPWYAPEVRVVRDFVNSRVIDGRQQIKAHITFHTNGELILYPYGYTYTDLPEDMTADDLSTFRAYAAGMAKRNGYKAQQSSALYITDGDQIDWMYGVHRIWSFTWELYPPETATVWGDHYPADENIVPQTRRNKSALLYFIDIASCPYRIVGKIKTHCGPLNDDLEINRGWAVNPDGTDTATAAGRWNLNNPETALAAPGHPRQMGTTTSGRFAFVTGAKAGASLNDFDLDGISTARSAPVALPAAVGDLTFRYYLAHDGRATAQDWLRVWVEDAGGVRTQVFEEPGDPKGDDAWWATGRVSLAPWAGQTIRLVIGAADTGADALVEAGIDDLRIERP